MASAKQSEPIDPDSSVEPPRGCWGPSSNGFPRTPGRSTPRHREREVRGVLCRWEVLPTPTIREGAADPALGESRRVGGWRAIGTLVSGRVLRADRQVERAQLGIRATPDRRFRVRVPRPPYGFSAPPFRRSGRPNLGWGSPVIVSSSAAGEPRLGALPLIERRSPDPLVPPRLLANRNLRTAAVIAFLFWATFGSVRAL
jgi:hypothetical protein